MLLDRARARRFLPAEDHARHGLGDRDRHGARPAQKFGFDQPVLSVCGDSTFFHAAIPALINGVYNKSNFVLVVLDNSATAMTGFQPHAGTGETAVGSPAPAIDIAKICRASRRPGGDRRPLRPTGGHGENPGPDQRRGRGAGAHFAAEVRPRQGQGRKSWLSGCGSIRKSASGSRAAAPGSAPGSSNARV
ncbi:MAG: thiamine pyrophosphate-dependent enzyme [Bacillus subtilis]|nr:thiamine pyrophosphate-dependent enzyme [Bacillus subtilis]